MKASTSAVAFLYLSWTEKLRYDEALTCTGRARNASARSSYTSRSTPRVPHRLGHLKPRREQVPDEPVPTGEFDDLGVSGHDASSFWNSGSVRHPGNGDRTISAGVNHRWTPRRVTLKSTRATRDAEHLVRPQRGAVAPLRTSPPEARARTPANTPAPHPRPHPRPTPPGPTTFPARLHCPRAVKPCRPPPRPPPSPRRSSPSALPSIGPTPACRDHPRPRPRPRTRPPPASAASGSRRSGTRGPSPRPRPAAGPTKCARHRRAR